MNYREEIEIDIIDLLHAILRKWRIIIIFMLLGALCLGSYSYFNPIDTNRSNTRKASIITRSELDDMRDKLDDKQAEEVILAVDSYLITKQEYEEALGHLENSVKNKIDADNCPKMVETYMISDYIKDNYAYLSEVTSADNIISLYTSVLTSEEVIEEIRLATGYDVDEVYIKELYEIKKSGLSMMDISVTAPSRQECEAIMTVLEKNISSNKSLISAINQHKIEKVNENYYEQLDTALSDTQREEQKSLINYQNSLLAIPTTFSSDQETFYEALIEISEGRLTIGTKEQKEAAVTAAKKKKKAVSETTTDEYDKELSDITSVIKNYRIVTSVEKRGISKIFIALGVLGGALLAVIWCCVLYILGGTLRTEADLSDFYKLSIFGCISTGGDNGRRKLFFSIDDCIERLFRKNRPAFSEEESFDIVCSGIGVSACKKNFKKIFITGAGNDDIFEGYKDRIAAELKKRNYLLTGCEVDVGKNVVYDPRALEKMAQSDGVVLVEKIGSSRYENIGNELDTIKKYDVEVMGVVVLE